MKMRILSLLLVFLLVMSFAAPAVSAEAFEPVMFTAAAPVMVKLAFDGITILVTSAVLAEIGMYLGKTMDTFAFETVEYLNKFASDVGKTLNGIFAAKNWICATSHECAAMLESEYFALGGAGGTGGKKDDDDKWYHKAKREENGEVKVNTERISEKDAVKELRKGRDIFTSKKELAEKVVNRVSKENYDKLVSKSKIDPEKVKFKELEDGNDLELHHAGQKGYYEHYHPKYQHARPHCWFWRR